MSVYFCSFADKRFHKSLKRIKTQAEQFGLFDGGIFCLNENQLKKDFRIAFKQFLQPYTFYLCAWKPQVILQCFEKMQEGDILLYADVGCHLNIQGIEKFGSYINIVSNSTSGILATSFDASMPEKHWTKGDAFDYFNCRSTIEITDTPQIQATTCFCRKSSIS
jgi:hypothetical protein